MSGDMEFSEKITIGPFENLDKLCLFAEYADDSKLRNSLGFYLGELLGIPYVSPYAYADVYINGEYYGLCALATKDMFTHHIADDGIQAVFELSSSTRGLQFNTDLQQQVRVHYGNISDVEYILEVFEYALSTQNWEMVSAHIDLQSWALKYAMEEFLFNTDLGWASQYFYLGEDGLIRPMLPWDYEWTMEKFQLNVPAGAQNDLAVNRRPGNWYDWLLSNPDFVTAVHSHLEQRFTPALSGMLTRHMEQDIQQIQGSWYCDRLRWQSTFVGNQSYITDISWLWDWFDSFHIFFENRRAFLLEYFSYPEDYRQLHLKYNVCGEIGNASFQLVVPAGSTFQEWTEAIYTSTASYLAEGFRGWFAEDGTPLEELGIVTEDTTLYGIFDGSDP